ncbi:hypothetical protein [Granulicella tundricola]|uniref:Uncharacterized protein n=1 Tax=Granulicella tundricola (strain ATCC BAA-1859 / DSM 23138 / MP5ACTX9) TaxID=1198114 RepID=E8X6K5_GRATM|nr:hypothetical protein [Granulicella tundricola]ADW71155.1 hypothetical protein AciX9_3873 [Granulicella tundricola MP5ACTX9]
MLVPLPAPPTQLTKVKTEVSFNAEDPWNGNRRGIFLLENYLTTLRNFVPNEAQAARHQGEFHRALRSETDGVTRFLPESLIELWLTNKVPTEALPNLLSQIEPTLRKSDYILMMRRKAMKVFAVFETICCSALVLLAVAVVVGCHAPIWIAVLLVLATASVCWGFLYLTYFGKLFRRKRQMKWLLDRVHTSIPSPTVFPDLPGAANCTVVDPYVA